jgi:ribokinase
MQVAVVGHVEFVDFVPVERFPNPGEVVHAEGSFARAAGGGSVVAVVLAELGAEVDFFCALGRDAEGERSDAELTERGVRVHVAWREQPTRRAVTLLEPDGERTIVTIGERLHPLGDDALPWERLDAAQGVYFTAGDAGALEQARRAKVLVASPRGRAALDREGPALDALVYSARDPNEVRWAETLAGRSRLMVETRGADGGHWSGSSTGSWDAVAPPGPPRDAYGCGDSFAAGFTFGLACGRSVADAARIGAECGARMLTRVGAP